VQESPLPGGPPGKPVPYHCLRTFLIRLCYPGEPKTLKTAWEYYNEGALAFMQLHHSTRSNIRTPGMEIIDREREKAWLEQMDTILIFVCLTPLCRQPKLIDWQAALFAGFISAFLIELLGRLEQNPIDIIQDVLIHQTQMMRNSSLGPYVPPDFSPPEHIVIVNALFYASLGVMLLAAFIAMLIKSWIREFDRGLGAMSLPEQRAKTREFRYLGMKRWKLPEIVGILPLLIQISLLLFSIGLLFFLFHISTPSFHVTTAIFGIGVLYYAVTTSISVFATSSPFHSPLSRTIARWYRLAHLLFHQVVEYFILPDIDEMPETAMGRVCKSIGTILHKSRPYAEKNFENPIAKVTTDEVQLSTVASVLHRTHDSAPNSQHSETLHWSVWQLAGSTACNTPSLFALPYWIMERENDEEYFSRRSPAMLVALLAVSLRGPYQWQVQHMTTVRALVQRMEISNVPGAQVVVAAFDYLYLDWIRLPQDIENMRQAESNLTNVTQRMELPTEELLWLLSTLSEHRCYGRRQEAKPFLIEICLAILSNHASKWGDNYSPDMVLLEAVVTLAAMSCSSYPNRLHSRIPTDSDERPWFFQNAQNPALFANWFEDVPSDYHKQLISLLFLVVSAFIRRYSYPLAIQYLTVITAKGDLPLYTSALTAIAPVLEDNSLSAISGVLVAPQTQELTPMILRLMIYGEYNFQDELLENYDLRLGANENPDPNFLAIVFMLSKHVPSYQTDGLKNVNPELKNPWLRLAARVVARLDIPDGSGLPMGSFYDHRLHNMIAALSLLRYTQGTVTHYTELLLLESFLESQEPSISSVALEYYMKTTISYPGPPAPSDHLSTAVSAVFNFILTDHPLRMGWTILDIFVDGFETLSVEWRRSFAEGFFTLSRRPLLKPRGRMESMTWESELEKILTWKYFHEEQQEREWTDSEFSGLDWMAMAWSLHLSQHSGRKGKGKPQNLGGPAVNGEFVLGALCKLLDAVPSYQLTPIIPKLCEFLQWFDDTDSPEHRRTISTRIREAVRMHEEFQRLHCFHGFHCMWYIQGHLRTFS